MKRFTGNAALLIILLLSVILMGSGCSSGTGPGQGIVTGTVTDALTGDPLSGVEVSVGTSVTTTDADGIYSLRDSPVGSRTLTAEKDGYNNYSHKISVKENTTTTHNFAMTTTTPATGSVSGRVVSAETDESVVGVVVMVGDVQGTTDEDGTYRIEGVVPGTDLEITAVDEQQPKRYKDYIETITVTADEETVHDFEMLPAPGRNVVFLSQATNLDEGFTPENNNIQVYSRDLVTGVTRIISKNPQANGEEPPEANSNCMSPDISADGRYVVFSSNATNLADTGEDGFFNIFLYNRWDNTMQLVTADADDHSEECRISADGRYVVFMTNASNLSDEITNPQHLSIIVRYDIENKTFFQVTPVPEEIIGPFPYSTSPVISADGRYVAFTSVFPNLIEGVAPGMGEEQIFRCDCNADENRFTLVSHKVGALEEASEDLACIYSISADGNYIAFESPAGDITNDEVPDFIGNIYFYDAHNPNATILITKFVVEGEEDYPNSWGPTISADGRYIAFLSRGEDLEIPGLTSGIANVFLFDRETGTMSLVSHLEGGGEVSSDSDLALIAPDGSYVLYQSEASDLVDVQGKFIKPQVYISTPNQSDPNYMISVDPDGNPGNGESYSPFFTAPF